MKKFIIILFILSISFIFIKKENEILIPNNSIRFRVIANSNNLEDQLEKQVIKDKVEEEVYELINNANNTNDVRNILQDNINKIDDIVANYNIPYQISYGNNYFPAKNYKGVLYPAGDYESLVITLGNGLGNNFWCVLFPPLCLIDNDSKDVSDIEYQFYVKKLINKF